MIFNLEKLKRHIRCVDLEESFNKYLYRYCFFKKKDISQMKIVYDMKRVKNCSL